MNDIDVNFMRDPDRQNYTKEFLRSLKPRQKLRRVFNTSQWVLQKGVLFGAELGLAAAVLGSVANFVRADIPMAITLSSAGVFSAKILKIKE
ncbi:MAG: hypothetical protein F6J89_13730 [Symploca sp. SIO1C4]|uniref:Uncharacterized protein n=1 Tax=Symploca sp. SIO1C4 TaxID=2607765 RepID=A0A6B3NCK2_9CYAN|nr:hypothetical protein [Symploca sp. SIO1C4]